MKNLMLVLALALGWTCSGQWVVTDPGSYAYQTQNIMNTLETMYTSWEHVEKVKEGAKKLQQVNSTIKQGQLVAGTLDNLNDVLQDLKAISNSIGSIKNPQIRRNVINYIELETDRLRTFKTLFSNTITSNILEGGDLQRIQVLTEINKESEALKKEIKTLSFKVKRF